MQRMSEERGKHMDSPASRADIRKFIKNYAGQVLLDDIADDLDSFGTFNEFFYRKLKPGCRPITDAADDAVLTSAADCRMIAFDSVSESRKFWIKVRSCRVVQTVHSDGSFGALCHGSPALLAASHKAHRP